MSQTTQARPPRWPPYTPTRSAPPQRERYRVGHCPVDRLTFAGTLDAIEALILRRAGGTVFTPNADHVVAVEHDLALREAYGRASLSLADGMSLVWASHLTGDPLPAKVSGSDLVWPLIRRAAERGWRVYLIGGLPGAAAESARRFEAECGLRVVGIDDGKIDLDDAVSCRAVAQRVKASRADLVFVALGAPKQELLIDRMCTSISPAVAIGVGASLDFVAGHVRRAPVWMQRSGLEWLFRLAQEPRRMWRRYLVQDPKFALIVLRTLRRPGGRTRPTTGAAARAPAVSPGDRI